MLFPSQQEQDTPMVSDRHNQKDDHKTCQEEVRHGGHGMIDRYRSNRSRQPCHTSHDLQSSTKRMPCKLGQGMRLAAPRVTFASHGCESCKSDVGGKTVPTKLSKA
mmetsp:Transcript_74980/g.188749  ORF Transcript_74980/g.188749 Transcript_74980/m.188749 type:complete len:106 (+) Transcript_74980:1284-1601(+)